MANKAGILGVSCRSTVGFHATVGRKLLPSVEISAVSGEGYKKEPPNSILKAVRFLQSDFECGGCHMVVKDVFY